MCLVVNSECSDGCRFRDHRTEDTAAADDGDGDDENELLRLSVSSKRRRAGI